MGRAFTPGRETLLEESNRSEGSWELRNFCFVQQLLEQRPGLANTTLKTEIPGADDAAGTQLKFTSGRVSKPKGVSGGQCPGNRDQALSGS